MVVFDYGSVTCRGRAGGVLDAASRSLALARAYCQAVDTRTEPREGGYAR
jgi:hypothetical protein